MNKNRVCGIGKYFKLKNWKSRFRRYNKIVNKKVHPVAYEQLCQIDKLKIARKCINSTDYERFVSTMIPNWQEISSDKYCKKLVEFYISHSLLKPYADDVFLDAAGGVYSYISKLPCKGKYLQDMSISEALKTKHGDAMKYIEGSVSSIPLPSKSVSKISCHHSFEHFQNNTDKEFIIEVQRLLGSHGRCCIIPIFISEHCYEIVSDDRSGIPFDPAALKVVDPTSALPGGNSCGDFARVYDLKCFEERIVNLIDSSRFKATLIQFSMDGEDVPNMRLKCHRSAAVINSPYRSLLLERMS